MEAAAVCVCEGTSHHVDPFFFKFYTWNISFDLQFWNLKVNNAVGPDDEVGTEGMFRQTISGVYRRLILMVGGRWRQEASDGAPAFRVLSQHQISFSTLAYLLFLALFFFFSAQINKYTLNGHLMFARGAMFSPRLSSAPSPERSTDCRLLRASK